MSISPITERQEWFANQLNIEGPHLWIEQERQELARKLAQDYHRGQGTWRIQEWALGPEGTVYGLTRTGELAILSIHAGREARDKALAVMRTLNALDCEMHSG